MQMLSMENMDCEAKLLRQELHQPASHSIKQTNDCSILDSTMSKSGATSKMIILCLSVSVYVS